MPAVQQRAHRASSRTGFAAPLVDAQDGHVDGESSTPRTLATYNDVRYNADERNGAGTTFTPGLFPLMIRSFRGDGTQDIHHGRDTRAARKTCPRLLWPAARKRLDRLQIAASLVDLRLPPGNRLEALQGERLGTFSIRVNDQYRICFRWTGVNAEDVEIVDYH